MPEVTGTKYEQSIREMLRLLYYSSIEAKIHDLRFGPALRRINELNTLGDSYHLIAQTLIARKVKKLLRPRSKVPRQGRVGWQF